MIKCKNGRKTIASIIIAVTLIAISSGSIAKQTVSEEKIGVVVTILPLADFVENVGGDQVKITVMVPPGASPHTYEPTPSQLSDISRAKMYVKVGSGIDFELAWMEKMSEMNKEMLVIDCSEGIRKIGDDPHIWNSPANAKIMVEKICKRLIKIDPSHKSYYTANRDRYLKELDDLDAYIHERLDNFKNRVFIVYHPAFGYFAREYNLTQLAIEHSGKEPTPKVIQNCIDNAKKYHLSYVYVAPQSATECAKAIAHEIGGKIVFIDSLPRSYIPNMKSVADSLALEFE